MLRNDTIICGTSTAGTGTLTLAACPAPPGGVDLYAWLTATGLNFVNGNAIIVSYTLIEYTDSTLSIAKNFEKGVGTVTLGASLTATTLARTSIQYVAGSLNTTGAPTYSLPSAVSIGTAANVLIFVGPSAADVPAFGPFYDTTLSGIDGVGVFPAGRTNVISLPTGISLTTLQDYYSIFQWQVPMLVRKCSVYVSTAYSGTGGTPISAGYCRIYQINSSGRPGKLLVDFGALSGTNPLNATGIKSTTALGTGFLLLPGEYFFDFMPSFSGATGPTPPIMGGAYYASNSVCRMGSQSFVPVNSTFATGGTAGAGPDPANTAGYAVVAGNAFACNTFALNPS